MSLNSHPSLSEFLSVYSQTQTHVEGLDPSSVAYLVAFLQNRDPGIRLVICADDDTAEKLRQDCKVLGQVFKNPVDRLVYLPSWGQSPYLSINPSIHVRFERLKTLSKLLLQREHGEPLTLFCSIQSLLQKTIPKEVFEELAFKIKLEESIGSRDEFRKRLIQLGYQQVDLVEDQCTFSMRGEIIDFFPPHLSHPVRVELFDDLVERMRQFDPQSQKTLTISSSTLMEVLVPVAREVIFQGDYLETIRTQVKQFCDEHDEISREAREAVLESIRSKSYPPSSDMWVPFAYEKPSRLTDYLPTSFHTVIYDSYAVNQAWKEFQESLEPGFQEALAEGWIVPKPDSLFDYPLLEEVQKKENTLWIDTLSSTDTKNRYVFKTEPHSVWANATKPNLSLFLDRLNPWLNEGASICLFSPSMSQSERVQFLLKERSIPLDRFQFFIGPLSQGFYWPTEHLVILSEREFLGVRNRGTQRQDSDVQFNAMSQPLQQLTDLNTGNAVVHRIHGVGIYQGLTRLALSGAEMDFISLEYAGKDKLYVPVYHLNVVQKYVGDPESIVIDKLGSQRFEKAKEKAKESVQKLAIDLLKLYAEREIQQGWKLSLRDSQYREFEVSFPFEETPDQNKAIESCHHDLESGRPMDRLVCGDVGFGKTEVAIRAAYRVVAEGKQALVLVPTTLLAIQHEQSFKNRLRETPVRIESLSRFKTAQEQKQIVKDFQDGKIDVLIGTHRLLSKDVVPAQLGIIIIDEEHRFGVEQKEKLKLFKANTHTLTLTATPIPRTLHMSLAGIRDISLMNTAPVNRLPIRTYVSPLQDGVIQKAVEFEFARGGQVFFVHNRVQTLGEMAEHLREILPQAKIVVAHGQMAERELEEAMMKFYKKEANLLLCSAIIESGLDIPSANTMLINRADLFGLAQLYQLRGRVGRYENRAYCYLFLPSESVITDNAKKRLEVIQRFVELGSGFNIASHDLELRGAGDLLGPNQSGHIAAIGFELYTEMLQEAIQESRKQKAGEAQEVHHDDFEPEIRAPFPAFFSENYIPDIHQRLTLYRRLSSAKSEAAITEIENELVDRFGPLPQEAEHLLWLVRIKLILKRLGFAALTLGVGKFSLTGHKSHQIQPEKLLKIIQTQPKVFQLSSENKLVVTAKIPTLKELCFFLESFSQKLLG